MYASIYHSFRYRSWKQLFRFLAALLLVAKKPKGFLVIVVGSCTQVSGYLFTKIFSYRLAVLLIKERTFQNS